MLVELELGDLFLKFVLKYGCALYVSASHVSLHVWMCPIERAVVWGLIRGWGRRLKKSFWNSFFSFSSLVSSPLLSTVIKQGQRLCYTNVEVKLPLLLDDLRCANLSWLISICIRSIQLPRRLFRSVCFFCFFFFYTTDSVRHKAR